MKRSLFACVGLMAMATSAFAADLPRRYPPPVPYKSPVYAPAYNWTGFYLGINGGGGWGRSTWTTTEPFDVSGGLVGGTVGYNFRPNQVVLGIEGDLDWANINAARAPVCRRRRADQTSNNWLGTVRGRLGYALIASCPTSPVASRSATSRPTLAGLPGTDPPRRLDARRRHRIRHRRPLDRQGRISLCRSRQRVVRRSLRPAVQRQLARQYRPRV